MVGIIKRYIINPELIDIIIQRKLERNNDKA
jgi:hypothetical protein